MRNEQKRGTSPHHQKLSGLGFDALVYARFRSLLTTPSCLQGRIDAETVGGRAQQMQQKGAERTGIHSMDNMLKPT
jgi:hypothetical protein